jgi:predicted transcriptional regulator
VAVAKRPVGTFRLQAEGLERVLGSIEAQVMEHVWAAAAPVSIRAVHTALQPTRPRSFNTVVSVMNHLVDKGLLLRERARRGHVFRPAVTRDEFLRQVSRQVATGLIRDFGDLAVAQFLDALREHDPEALARLASLIERERSEDARR